MHDLAHAFRAKLAELSIDGNATSGVDYGERRIAAVNCVESKRFACFVFSGCVSGSFSCSGAAGNISSSSAGLFRCSEKVARRLSQSHLPKVNERAPRETFGVIVDDVVRVRSGNKPPNNYRPAGFIRISSSDFEYEESRTSRGAPVVNLITARYFHHKFQRCFDTLSQIAYMRWIRAVFVTHRQVIQQILDCRITVIFLAKMAGNFQGELLRKGLAEAGNPVFV